MFSTANSRTYILEKKIAGMKFKKMVIKVIRKNSDVISKFLTMRVMWLIPFIMADILFVGKKL